MKKLLSVILFFALCLGLYSPAAAESAAPEKFSTSDDYVYILKEDGTAEITGYTGNGTKLSVPSELEGHTVTSLGTKAFYENKKLTEVLLPDTMKTLGEQCFSWCEKLQSVSLPEGLETIGYNVFYCCKKLAKVNIPLSVKKVTGAPFAGCDALKQIALPEDHPLLEMVDGVLFNKVDSVLLWYPVSRNGKEYQVPAGTKQIGRKSFFNAKPEKIILPDSIESLPPFAFENCVSLKSVNIPPRVASVDGVFKSCDKLEAINVDEGNEALESIDGVLFDRNARALVKYPVAKKDKTYTVPEGTEAIQENAFESVGLTGIIIPDSVRVIGQNAFLFCKKLKEVVLPEGLAELGNHPFQWCSSLVRADLPASLVKIDGNPFLNCEKLTEIVVAEGNQALALVNGCLVWTEEMTLVCCPAGIKDKKLEFPAGIRKIETNAFSNCKSLEEVVFGEGLEEIQDSAFRYCKALKRVVLPASVTEIHRSAFTLDDVKKTVFVVTPGSYAENFCTSYGLNIEYANE